MKCAAERTVVPYVRDHADMEKFDVAEQLTSYYRASPLEGPDIGTSPCLEPSI